MRGRSGADAGSGAHLDLERYGAVAVTLHWSIATLIIVNWGLGYLAEWIEEAGANAVPLHKSIGLTVLALSLARLAWRLVHPAPALPASMGGWRRRAALATHFLFYVLIITLPLTGWLRTSAGKYPLTWFGLTDVPKFPVARETSAVAATAHELMAWAMLALLILHVAAALHHHFRLRDGILLRMLPARRRAGR